MTKSIRVERYRRQSRKTDKRLAWKMDKLGYVEIYDPKKPSRNILIMTDYEIDEFFLITGINREASFGQFYDKWEYDTILN